MKDFFNKKNPQVELAKEMINAYRKNAYPEIPPDVLTNLIELKEITSEPKQYTPDIAFQLIKERLGQAESNETLRRERWHGKVKCPACRSSHVKILSESEKKSKGNYKYLCETCDNKFNDDTGTPLENVTPPLSTWMFCWYLMGCTNSLQYIASKLGLDIATVELMVRHMQKMFKAQQPLTHFMSFDEWSLKHGKSYKQKIMQEIATRQELFTGDTPNAPQDTSEYRRQKDRARNPLKPRNRSS